jgi:threonine/homoserine/homoserine lactone efflux protein
VTAAAFLSIVLIHLLASISPGPAFVVSVRTAAAEGFRPAAALAVGVGLGSLIWATAALLGLALLFQVAPALLTALKVAGGLFLIWIAVETWRHAAEPLPAAAAGAAPRGLGSGVRLGLLTQLANPKTAVFFGAVFVGLVPPGTGAGTLGLLLAVIFVNEALWFALVGRLFSLDRARAAYGRGKRWIDRAFGGLIGALGIRIATG